VCPTAQPGETATILVSETRSRTLRDSWQIYLRARGDTAFEFHDVLHFRRVAAAAALKAGQN